MSRRRFLLLASPFALAVTLAACGGGGSGGHSMSTMSPMSTMSAPAAPSPASSASSAGTGGTGLPATPTYPPVTPGPAASGPHNDTDVMFANDMIPHHGQAVVMAGTILARTGDPQVKALAENIERAQTPEIATMSGWLRGWGSKVPDPYGHEADMAGMTHGGMMSAEQMKQLSDATGRAADKAFLTLMIEHHQGAIDMAKGEIAQGANPEAKTLARSVVDAQTAEIARMTSLLASLG